MQTGNTPHNLEEPTLEDLMRKMTKINIKFQEWATNKYPIQNEEPRQMKEINMKYDKKNGWLTKLQFKRKNQL